MRQLGRIGWAALIAATACTGQPRETGVQAPKKPIQIELLARAAEKEVGAMLEVLNSDRATRAAMGAVNGALVRSGLARGLPNQPATDDAETCFRNAAANRGLQITSVKSRIPELAPSKPRQLQPGQRWDIKREELIGTISVEVVVEGPLPSVAALIDEVGQCNRIVAVRSATVVGNAVTLKADAWFERSLETPELDLRWRSLDERLMAAGWKPNDPAVAKDPELGHLKAAVDFGREQLPRVRNLMKTTVELPRWILRARELIVLKQEVLQIQGAKLLGLKAG